MATIHLMGDRKQEMKVREQEPNAAFKVYPLGFHFLKEMLPHNVLTPSQNSIIS